MALPALPKSETSGNPGALMSSWHPLLFWILIFTKSQKRGVNFQILIRQHSIQRIAKRFCFSHSALCGDLISVSRSSQLSHVPVQFPPSKTVDR
ncbi:hypothetical protein ACLOJK_008946 [Asimina triloba]